MQPFLGWPVIICIKLRLQFQSHASALNIQQNTKLFTWEWGNSVTKKSMRKIKLHVRWVILQCFTTSAYRQKAMSGSPTWAGYRKEKTSHQLCWQTTLLFPAVSDKINHTSKDIFPVNIRGHSTLDILLSKCAVFSLFTLKNSPAFFKWSQP